MAASYTVPEFSVAPVLDAYSRAIGDTLRQIDGNALRHAIATRDPAAILATLGIERGDIPALSQRLSDDFYESLSTLYTAAGRQANESLALKILLSDLLGPFEIQFSELVESTVRDSAQTIRESIPLYFGLDDDEIIALVMLGSIGLTRSQVRSLTVYARILVQATAKPGSVTLTALQLRFLNAAQRSQLTKALAAGPLDPKLTRRLITRQAADLFTLRAVGVSITAVTTFSGHGAEEAVKRSIASGRSKAGDFRKFWVTAHDEKVRSAHNATESMNAAGVAIGEPFRTPFGPVQGPPLEINCRCRVTYVRKQ